MIAAAIFAVTRHADVADAAATLFAATLRHAAASAAAIMPRFDTNITPFSLAMSFAPDGTNACSPSRLRLFSPFMRHYAAADIITLFMPLCFDITDELLLCRCRRHT